MFGRHTTMNHTEMGTEHFPVRSHSVSNPVPSNPVRFGEDIHLPMEIHFQPFWNSRKAVKTPVCELSSLEKRHFRVPCTNLLH